MNLTEKPMVRAQSQVGHISCRKQTSHLAWPPIPGLKGNLIEYLSISVLRFSECSPTCCLDHKNQRELRAERLASNVAGLVKKSFQSTAWPTHGAMEA